MATQNVHGKTISYDQSAEFGVKYLRDSLGYDKAQALFNQAVSSPANFTCESGTYKLSWIEGSNYKVSKKY